MYEKIIQALLAAHRMMEHVLTLVRIQVDILHPESGVEQYAFLRRAVGYLHNYPGLIHHPAEEIIFERLVRYAPHTGSVCNRLAEEHETFRLQEAAMVEGIRNIPQANGETHRRIKQLGIAYCMTHSDHIQDEEAEVFPQAVNWLLPDDWRTIEAQCHFDVDPLSNPKVLEGHESLYDYLMVENVNFDRH